MMNNVLKGILLACLFIPVLAFSAEVEHVLWKKEPIRIKLPLNEERVIRFPKAISVVDSELDEGMGIMKIEGALYLRADQAFSNQRLVVQLMPEGEAIVLSFSASDAFKDTTPVEVLLPKEEGGPSSERQEGLAPSGVDRINPVSLTRFAIQSLYSPARVVQAPEGVSRTPMHTYKNITLVYGASVLARPLISWTGNGLYVTAVELRNDLSKEIVLDPRQMIGEWQTATFFPTNTLSPRGKDSVTTVFLISDRPFGEALDAKEEFVR